MTKIRSQELQEFRSAEKRFPLGQRTIRRILSFPGLRHLPPVTPELLQLLNSLFKCSLRKLLNR